MAKRRINVCISEDKWQRVRELAARRRTSASAVLEEALEQALGDEELLQAERTRAIREIMALDLGPVGPPEELEKELEAAHAPCLEADQ